jgi:hypothetical protein
MATKHQGQAIQQQQKMILAYLPLISGKTAFHSQWFSNSYGG